MIITDLEFGLILTLIFALFIKGLKKKEEPEVFFSLDKSMSVGLKGISCILILIAHFYNMYHWRMTIIAYPGCIFLKYAVILGLI